MFEILGINAQIDLLKRLKRFLSLYSKRSKSALILNKNPSELRRLLEIGLFLSSAFSLLDLVDLNDLDLLNKGIFKIL